MTQPAPASGPPLLARRVGPLPLGVWLILFVLGLALFLWWRKRNAKTSDTGTDLTGALPPMVGAGPRDWWATVPSHPGGGWDWPGHGDDPYTPPRPPNTNRPPRGPVITNPPPPTDRGIVPPGTDLGQTPVNQPDTPPAVTTVTYPIKSGDTLSGIAAKFGIPDWRILYNANKSVIDARARQAGVSPGGHWIFPGTVLAIPS